MNIGSGKVATSANDEEDREVYEGVRRYKLLGICQLPNRRLDIITLTVIKTATENMLVSNPVPKAMNIYAPIN
jgi:hypothetical protein